MYVKFNKIFIPNCVLTMVSKTLNRDGTNELGRWTIFRPFLKTCVILESFCTSRKIPSFSYASAKAGSKWVNNTVNSLLLIYHSTGKVINIETIRYDVLKHIKISSTLFRRGYFTKSLSRLTPLILEFQSQCLHPHQNNFCINFVLKALLKYYTVVTYVCIHLVRLFSFIGPSVINYFLRW